MNLAVNNLAAALTIGSVDGVDPALQQSAALAALADGLASQLRPAAEVWSDFGIRSRAEASHILALPAFRAMYAEARRRWHSDDNAAERIKAKSLLSIEHNLLTLHAAVGDGKLPLNHRAEILKLLSKWAHLDAGATAAGAAVGGGGGVSIRIDLSSAGGDARSINVLAGDNVSDADADVEPDVDEGDAGPPDSYAIDVDPSYTEYSD